MNSEDKFLKKIIFSLLLKSKIDDSQRQELIFKQFKEFDKNTEENNFAVLKLDKSQQDDFNDNRKQAIALYLKILLSLEFNFLKFADEFEKLTFKIITQIHDLSYFNQGIFWHAFAYIELKSKDDYFNCLIYLNRSIDCFEKCEADSKNQYLGRVYDTFGDMLFYQGIFTDAEENYLRAKTIKEQVNDVFGISKTLRKLGNFYLKTGKFKEAESTYKNEIGFLEENPNNKSLSMAKLNLAKTFILVNEEPFLKVELNLSATSQKDLSNLDKAEKLIFESLDLLETCKGNINKIRAFCFLTLGEIETRRANCEKAEEFFIKAGRQISIGNYNEKFVDGVEGYISWGYARIQRIKGPANIDEANSNYKKAYENFQSSTIDPVIDNALLLAEHTFLLLEEGRKMEATRTLTKTLSILDTTEAESLRNKVEETLKKIGKEEELILHRSGRFLGHEEIRLKLEQTGKSGTNATEENVAILFADIRGFTRIFNETESPELFLEQLNNFLGQMTKCIQNFNGFVDKFIGDAIMAVFSLPKSGKNDCDNALKAALMMQQELERDNKFNSEREALGIGIGLHYGSVSAGLIGFPSKRSYTVIGPNVNLASRLEGMTKALNASILVSREFKNKLVDKDKYLLRPLGFYRPQGIKDRIEVFDFMGMNDQSSYSQDHLAELKECELAWKAFHESEANKCLKTLENLDLNTNYSGKYQNIISLLKNTMADNQENLSEIYKGMRLGK